MREPRSDNKIGLLRRRSEIRITPSLLSLVGARNQEDKVEYVRFISVNSEQHVGSCPFTPDSSGQLDVLGHDGHPLSVDSLQAEIRATLTTHHFYERVRRLTQRLVSSKRPTR